MGRLRILGVDRPFPSAVSYAFAPMAGRRHDPRALARRASRAQSPQRPPTSPSGTAAGRGLLGGGRRGASTSSRTGCSRSASRKGDAFAILAATSARVVRCSTSRSALVGAVGAPIYANSSPHDCAYVLDHSEAVGVLVEDEEQLREGRRGPRRAAAPPPRPHVRRPRPSSRRAAASYAAAHPDALDERDRRGRRGRPLHLHLHLGHDRAAEGLHDPPPQLLRDGGGGRRACRGLRRRRATRCSSTCRSRTTSGG